MSGFSAKEFEVLPVVGRLEPYEQNRRALTHAEVDELEAIGHRQRLRLIDHPARNKVRFRQFVGLVRIGGRDIEILPKIESPDGEQGPSGVRGNLLSMLSVAVGSDIRLLGEAQSFLSHASWLDVFIHQFCRQLVEQARRGVVKRYRIEEDDLGSVRGNLVIHEQVRRNFIHKERIACEFDELDENHGLNQLFKLALERMLRFARHPRTQRQVREALTYFEAVALRPLDGGWWRAVKLDRMSARFEAIHRLAVLFLSGFTPDVGRGGNDAFALLFDMNVLFEEYVGRKLRTQLAAQGLAVGLQDARHHLMHAEDGAGHLFRLRPDIVVSEGARTRCIADTKWKRLDDKDRKLGVSQADLYQMLAYARRYACDRILMIYPYERSDAPRDTDGVMLRYQGQETTVLVGQVCLADLRTVGSQLQDLYARAVDVDSPLTEWRKAQSSEPF